MINEVGGAGRGGQLWRSITDLPESASPWSAALRRGWIVAFLLAVGGWVGDYQDLSTAAIGALFAGLVQGAVGWRTMVTVMSIVTLTIGVLAFVSSALAGTWWLLVVIFAVALVSGTVSGSGIVANYAGLIGLITVICLSSTPNSVAGALVVGLWAGFGALVQSLAGLTLWRYERVAFVRRPFAISLRRLRRLALARPERLVHRKLAAAEAETAAENALLAANLSPRDEINYQDLLRELTWTRVVIVQWLTREGVDDEGRRALSDELRAISAGPRGRSKPMQPDLHDQLRDPGKQRLVDQIDRLKAAWERATGQSRIPSTASSSQTKGVTESPARQPTARSAKVRSDLHRFRESVVAIFDPSGEAFRNGLRLAVAVGIAEAVALGFDISRGYWIALTVALVIKPDFASTITRGILRIIGTIAAVLLVGLALLATGSPQWLMVAMVAVFAPMMMRWFSANYGLFAFAVTASVLILMEGGSPSLEVVILRFENTLIGAAIAVAAYFIRPAWRGDQLSDLLVEMVEAQRRWTVAVLNALGSTSQLPSVGQASTDNQESLSKMLLLGKQSRSAAGRALAAAQGAVIEPHNGEADPTAGLAVLDACQHAALITLGLEADIRSLAEAQPGSRGDSSSQVSAELTARVSASFAQDMQVAAALLRGNAGPDAPHGAAAESDVTASADPGEAAAVSRYVRAADVDPATERALAVLLVYSHTAANESRNVRPDHLSNR